MLRGKFLDRTSAYVGFFVRFVADCQLRVHMRIDMISRVAELATYKRAVVDGDFLRAPTLALVVTRIEQNMETCLMITESYGFIFTIAMPY